MIPLRIATRKSPLALAQANLVATFITAAIGAPTTLVPLTTTGDKQAAWSLEQHGGKGLFTKEIEDALLTHQADLAVHSAKDLPGDTTPGLSIAGYLPREDPRDILILRNTPNSDKPVSDNSALCTLHPALANAPATIATSSARRRLQIRHLYPSATHTEIRGNIHTRLEKIATRHEADATILAAAGLRRLNIPSHPNLTFKPLTFLQLVPAVAQAAIAIQCRTPDAPKYSRHLHHPTKLDIDLERALQTALGAGCHTAFAAHASADTLYFFHEHTGTSTHPIPPLARQTPTDFARHLLTSLRLL